MSATDTRPAVDARRRFERAWETKRLADVAVVDPESLGSNTPRDFSFRYISLEDVSLGKIHGWTDVRFCEAPSRARRRVRSGDILFGTVRPNLKSHARLPDGFGEAVCSTGFATLRCDPNSAEPGFVFPLFFIKPIERQIEKIISGSNYPAISSSDVKALTASFPSLPEQRAIAAALSDVDGLLQSLDRLIAKKRDVKQGAMQQLLTGTTRLPGFEGAWETRPIGECGQVMAGKALNATGPGVRRPYLRTVNVLDGEIRLDDVLEMPMTEAEYQRYILREGDVLLNEGQSLELVGRCAIVPAELEGRYAIQNQLLRFRALAEASPLYASYLFRYFQATGVFQKISLQTTSVAHLGVSRFARLEATWPSIPEQRAIAAVLSDMDAEIDALEARRSKVAAIKQGMMQELLTGRTRLPIPEEAIDA